MGSHVWRPEFVIWHSLSLSHWTCSLLIHLTSSQQAPENCVYWRVLGMELNSSCLHGENFTNLVPILKQQKNKNNSQLILRSFKKRKEKKMKQGKKGRKEGRKKGGRKHTRTQVHKQLKAGFWTEEGQAKKSGCQDPECATAPLPRLATSSLWAEETTKGSCEPHPSLHHQINDLIKV